MCYTGVCFFEHTSGPLIGECKILDHTSFQERYGEPPCIVGQCPHNKEEEKYIEDNKERLEEILRKC